MKLQAWRTAISNPCDGSRVFISLAPIEKGAPVFPWVIPLGYAEEIFGKDDIAQIGEVPRQVFLSMVLANRSEP